MFADYADCLRRIDLFVQHYNFQRPHQGIDGLDPADRFFRAAPHVRAAIEGQIKANALLLAQEKPAQKPFYLVGRLGDQDLSIAAANGALRVQVGDTSQTIPMTKEQGDETNVSRILCIEDPQTTSGQPSTAGAALRDSLAAPGTQHHQAASPSASALTEVRDEAQASNECVNTDENGSPTQATPAWLASVIRSRRC